MYVEIILSTHHAKKKLNLAPNKKALEVSLFAHFGFLLANFSGKQQKTKIQ